jgi:hypothetical protein
MSEYKIINLAFFPHRQETEICCSGIKAKRLVFHLVFKVVIKYYNQDLHSSRTTINSIINSTSQCSKLQHKQFHLISHSNSIGIAQIAFRYNNKSHISFQNTFSRSSLFLTINIKHEERIFLNKNNER